MNEEFVRSLLAGAEEMELEFTPEQVGQCARFAQMVVAANERMNLTSLVEPNEMAIKHFVDSATCLRVGDWPRKARGVDVGTGAGFPGVVLAILRPDITWFLVDSLRKRIDFLGETVRSLGLSNVTCVHARAEEVGRQRGLRGSFDVAVARAVARLPVLLEYCAPLVRPGGGFLAMKGPEVAREIAEAQRAAELLGAAEPVTLSLALPCSAGGRTLVWYAKTQHTSQTYPRRPGLPGQQPL